jgi:hypothetical protein
VVNDGQTGVVAEREVDQHHVWDLGGCFCESVGKVGGSGYNVSTVR